LKAPGFNPLSPSSEKTGFKLCFHVQLVPLNHGVVHDMITVGRVVPNAVALVGLALFTTSFCSQNTVQLDGSQPSDVTGWHFSSRHFAVSKHGSIDDSRRCNQSDTRERQPYALEGGPETQHSWFPGRAALTPGCQIGYMDYTGCQLNRTMF
jgi:hypothetical protein